MVDRSPPLLPMASQREIQLILKLVDQASRQLSAVQGQLGQLQKVQTSYQQAQQQVQRSFQAQSDAAREGQNGLKSLASGVKSLAEGYFFVTNAIQGFAAAGRQAYQLLIGANEDLRQQFLKSAGTITATSDVLVNGIKQSDPTTAIQALLPEIQRATKQIEKDTLDLVGVTSEQTIGVFNAILAQAGQLNNQLKSLDGTTQQYANSIEAAEKLTSKATAALGSAGLGSQLLGQAQQEFRDILSGYAGADTQVARLIGVTTADLQKARAAGNLVAYLEDRLKSFSAANKLAAQSIGGISSNLTDLIQIIARESGAPLLDYIVADLDKVYKAFQENQGQIQEFAQNAIKELIPLLESIKELATAIGTDLVPVVQVAAPLIVSLFQTIGDGIKLFSQGFVAANNLIKDNVDQITKYFEDLANNPILAPFIKQFQLIANIVNQNGGNIFATAADAVGSLTGAVDRSTQALEIYRTTNDRVLAGAVKNQQDLKAAQDLVNAAKKEGRDLNDQEASSIKSAVEAGKGQIEALKQQRQALLDARPSIVGEENRRALNGQIDAIDRQIKAQQGYIDSLDGVANKVEIQQRSLMSLGTVFDDLARQALQAKNGIDSATSNDAASKSANELVKITQERLRLGAITQKQAIDELNSIAGNSKLSADTRIAAEKAVTGVYQQQSKNRISAIDTEIQQIQNAVESGSVSRIDGEKKVTAKRKEQLDIQIKDLNAQLKRLKDAGQDKGQDAQAARAELNKLNAEREKLTIDSNERIFQLQLEDFDKAQRRLLDRTKVAETERLAALTQLRVKEPLLDAQIAQERLQIQRESIDKELKAAQDRLAYLERLGRQQGQAEKDRQDEITKQRQTIAGLIENQAENELSQQQALYKVISDQIDRQKNDIQNIAQEQKLASDAQIRALETQVDLQQKLTQSQQNQLALLDGIKGVVEATTALEKARFDVLIGTTPDEKEKAKLQEAAALSQYNATVQRLAIERQVFEIQEKQRVNAQKIEEIQNRIAQAKAKAAITEADAQAAQARADFAKVAADPNATPEQVQAAMLGIKAADAQRLASRQAYEGTVAEGELIQEKGRVGDQVARMNRRAMNDRQEAEMVQADFQLAQSIADPGRREQAFRQLNREQRQRLSGENRRINFQSDRARGRRGLNRDFGIVDEAGDRSQEIIDRYENAIEGIRLSPADVDVERFIEQRGRVTPIAPVQQRRALSDKQQGQVPRSIDLVPAQQRQASQAPTVTIGQVSFTNTFANRDDENLLSQVREGLSRDLSGIFSGAARELQGSGVI